MNIWNHRGLGGKCRTSCPWTCRKTFSRSHPDGLFCAQGSGPQAHVHRSNSSCVVASSQCSWFWSRSDPYLVQVFETRSGCHHGLTRGTTQHKDPVPCVRESTSSCWLLQKQMPFHARTSSAFLSIFFFYFFLFTQLSELYNTAGKRQLQWGTALKHSCFVPFLLMQTFHGLSTWITFRWCSRTIFARTHLIAALSTLCKVHSLYFHLTLNINYIWPKIAFIY